MVYPTSPSPSKAQQGVPVSPLTPWKAVRRVLATLLVSAYFAVQTLNQALPQIAHAFPKIPWLPPAISLVGALWLVIQRITDGRNIFLVNYSDPPSEPPPYGRP